jgi:flavorubredoxin
MCSTDFSVSVPRRILKTIEKCRVFLLLCCSWTNSKILLLIQMIWGVTLSLDRQQKIAVISGFLGAWNCVAGSTVKDYC